MGVVLLSKLNDESLVVVIEALNAIFDVFGEDHTHNIFVSLNFLSILKAYEPKLSDKVNES